MPAGILSIVVLSCLILLYLQAGMVDKNGNKVRGKKSAKKADAQHVPNKEAEKKEDKEDLSIQPLTKYEIAERGVPEKWPEHRWYYTTANTEFDQGDQKRIEKVFKKRYKELVKNETVLMKSEQHPSCAAAGILQNQRFSRRYGAEFPCRRPNSKPWEQGEYHVLQDTVYYQGDLWSKTSKMSVSWAGSYSTLKGKRHTVLEDNITLKKLSVNKTDKVVEIGYYQTPTDYHSMYHVFVEVLLPFFHATLPFRLRGEEQNIAVFQPTARSRAWAMKPEALPGLVHQLKSQKDSCITSQKAKCLSTEPGKMMEMMAPGGIYMEENNDVVAIKRLIVGAPTNCQPLWMTDGVIISATDSADVKHECEKLYWLWRQYWVKKHSIPTPGVKTRGNRVLWATRRKSWTRNILNEEAIFAKIRSLGDHVQMTDFRMPIKDQFAMLQTITHYVTPHGASHLHALMLSPASILISIDTSFPSMSGITIELPWIHYFHFRADRECNPLYPATRHSCSTAFTKKTPTADSLSHVSINVTSFIQLYLTTTELTMKGGLE